MAIVDGEEIQEMNRMGDLFHTIWLGGGKKNDVIMNCEELIPRPGHHEWNYIPSVWLEDCKYFMDAIRAEHWAAASDVLRWKIMYDFGGCYIDSDVELIDPFLMRCLLAQARRENLLIIGKEDNENICGAVIVSKKGHWFSKQMLDKYYSISFSDTFKGSGHTVNGTTLITREVKKIAYYDSFLNGECDNNGITNYNGLCLFESNRFYPIHWRDISVMDMGYRTKKAKDMGAIALHHWEHSWKPENK